ncbi:hypothetical protein T492DRAFT_1038708 [Pavlovales sp. CCMP2436]|nr:hypothetical protein T492DRAFT_1038708 [Pavlovales sp. CCMP2436]
MLESSLRRLEVGQPPLLGLRWLPSEVRLVRTPLRGGSNRARPGMRAGDQLRIPPNRQGGGGSLSRSPGGGGELEDKVERLTELGRKKDRQIRWLQELAIDGDALIPARETESLKRRRAMAQWRMHTSTQQRARALVAFRDAEQQRSALEQRLAKMEAEREALVIELTHEARTIEQLYARRANTWRLGRAAAAWRLRTFDGPTLFAVARVAESRALGRGLRGLRAALVRADGDEAARARGASVLRLRARLRMARALGATAERVKGARALLARAAEHRARTGLRGGLLHLFRASRRAALRKAAEATERAAALSEQLAEATKYANVAAAAARARTAHHEKELRRWKSAANERLRGAEELLGATGVEAMVGALARLPGAGGAAQRPALTICATALDGLRTQLVRSEAKLEATRELSGLPKMRRLREQTLAELAVFMSAAGANEAQALGEAVHRHEAAHSVRTACAREQLARAHAWRSAHAVELYEGGLNRVLNPPGIEQ